jgi:hypothetical protein
MAAFVASQMAVVPVARAAVSAKAQAAPVAPRAVKVASFSAKLSVSNATEKKTNAFMVWKSQGNKCVRCARELRASAGRTARERTRRAAAGTRRRRRAVNPSPTLICGGQHSAAAARRRAAAARARPRARAPQPPPAAARARAGAFCARAARRGALALIQPLPAVP